MESPAQLSQVRAINPGHMLMFSTNAEGKLNPIVIREEPLRGLNASHKSKEEEKKQAVLQVVETAELAAGDDILVLKGKVLVRNTLDDLHSCSDDKFTALHTKLVVEAKSKGLVSKLAERYALTLACGNWAWRNALEATSIEVKVSWVSDAGSNTVSFKNLQLDATDVFDYTKPGYAAHREALVKLAEAINAGLTGAGAGVLLNVEAQLQMGLGARVYPSQEWASEEHKNQSKVRWPGGEGVTRILAKLNNGAGQMQAIINDRKVGNALRAIDTWYAGEAAAANPIAVEVYGGNSHKGVAYRKADDSMFSILKKIASGAELTEAQILFYLAMNVRGGVFGVGKE